MCWSDNTMVELPQAYELHASAGQATQRGRASAAYEMHLLDICYRTTMAELLLLMSQHAFAGHNTMASRALHVAAAAAAAGQQWLSFCLLLLPTCTTAAYFDTMRHEHRTLLATTTFPYLFATSCNITSDNSPHDFSCYPIWSYAMTNFSSAQKSLFVSHHRCFSKYTVD